MPEETASTVAYRTWMCVVCGFLYDEAAAQVRAANRHYLDAEFDYTP